MSDGEIPTAVRRLLQEYVESFEKLDILLLLLRTGGPLPASEIADRLKLGIGEVRESLSELAADRLIARLDADHWSYRPADDESRRTVASLAKVFEEDPIRVVRWMSANSIERVRNSAAAAFANALLFKRKKREP
jgi:DNA-binding GntR family transcriptional regulator